MTNILIVSSVIIGAIFLGICGVFFYLEVAPAEWAQLLGSTVGGAVGSLALIYVAIYTIAEQQKTSAEARGQEDLMLLIAIWAEIKVAFETQKVLLDRVCSYIDSCDNGQSEEELESLGWTNLYEGMSLKILDENLQRVGRFGLATQDALIHLHFEMKMQARAWNSHTRGGAVVDARTATELRNWILRSFVRLIVARFVLANDLRREDRLNAGRLARNIIDAEHLEIIADVIGAEYIEEIFNGLDLPTEQAGAEEVPDAYTALSF